MKLYTEEQVTELLKEIYKDDFNKGADIIPIILGKELTPIELPSDEDIEKLRDEHIPIDEEDMWSERLYFNIGAKAMLDKIQGDNK